jgi:uncharacterized protein YndB with AHSA1/START domain
MQNPITVSALVAVPPEQAWKFWCSPEHITRWNAASPDWHTPHAKVDLRAGGQWSARMEARDGSIGFDFVSTIEELRPGAYLRYIMTDGRVWEVSFAAEEGGTRVTERFEPETMNPHDLQQQGWQSILDNFKRHAEARSGERPLRFEIMIAAPPQRVYDLMLAPDSYRAWTSEFNPTSTYEGSWAEGSMIRFLGCDAEGRIGGMVSRIRRNIPATEISIEHLGLIKDGVDMMDGPEVAGWSGAIEHYAFHASDGGTRLVVSLEAHADFVDYFEDTWPKALTRLKAIAEGV